MPGRTTIKRIRGHALSVIRRDWFARYPLCKHCDEHGVVRLATQLDHIIPLDQGGPDFDRDNEQNRQGLCDECHDIKTALDMGYTRRVRSSGVAPDGWPIIGEK